MPLIVEIKVVPRSGKLACKLEGGRLKCYLKAAPEKNKANKELVAYLAKMVQIPVAGVTIIAGQTSRVKRISIDAPLTFATLCEKLGIQRQLLLF